MQGKQDRLSSIVFILMGIGACLEGISLSPGNFHRPGPGFFPLFGGMLLILLAAIVFSFALFNREDSPPLWVGTRWMQTLKTICIVLLFPLLLRWGGFILTATLTMSLLFRQFGMKRWPVIIGASIFASLFCYVLFALLLGSEFPRGYFGLL